MNDSETSSTTESEGAEKPLDLRGALRDAVKDQKDEAREEKAVEAPKAEAQAAQPARQEGTAYISPADMTPEERDAFSKLTPEMQRYVNRRSYETRTEYTKRMQELSERERGVSEWSNLFNDQERAEFVRLGISPTEAARRGAEWDRALRTGNKAAALEFLRTYGFTPEQLQEIQLNGGVPEPEQTQQYLTREQAEQIAEEKFQTQIQKIQDQQRLLVNTNAVQSFIQSKPEMSDPMTALAVEQAMAGYVVMRAQQAPSEPPQAILQWAYDAALKLEPTLQPLLRQQEAKLASDRVTLETREAQAARQAARSIHGGPGSGTPKLQAKNLRENLRMRFNGSV